MSNWIQLEVPVVEKPEHQCDDGMIRIFVYEKHVMVRITRDQVHVPFAITPPWAGEDEYKEMKLYHCSGCAKPFGVWA